MKKLFVCLIYLFGVIFFNTASALTPEQIEHEETLTKLATERCNTEQIEGSDYSVKVLANGKVEVSFFGKKGGEVEGKFVYEKSEWEGRQRVLREHQSGENKDRRKCIREELKSLRESYKTPEETIQEINNSVLEPGTGYIFSSQRTTSGSGSVRDIWWNRLELVPGVEMYSLGTIYSVKDINQLASGHFKFDAFTPKINEGFAIKIKRKGKIEYTIIRIIKVSDYISFEWLYPYTGEVTGNR